MDFFTKLKNLAVDIDRELKDLGAVNIPLSTPPEGVRSKLLRDISNELHDMKTGMRQVSNELKSSSDFVEQVRLASVLVSKQVKLLEETEHQLAQYGYTPRPASPAPDPVHRTTDESPQTPPSSKGQPTQETIMSQAPENVVLDLDRTPTLEDFGLSRARLQELKAPVLTSTRHDTVSSAIQHGIAIPRNRDTVAMENDYAATDDGTYALPAMSYKVATLVKDLPPPLNTKPLEATPDYMIRNEGTSDRTPTLEDFGLSTSRLQKLKGPASADGDDPIAPVLTSDSTTRINYTESPLSPQPRYPLLPLDNTDDPSPVVPQLLTPGVRLTNKMADAAVVSWPTYDDTDPDTPQPPELTSIFAKNLRILSANSQD